MLDSIFIPSPPSSSSLDGLRKMNRARRLGFIGTPEFERIFDDLFKGIDIEKILRKHLQPVDRPKVSIKIDDGEPDQELKDNFKRKVGSNEVEDDTEEEEEPYIHEPDVMYAEDDDEGLDKGDAYEDDESEKAPPSIFDLLSSGKDFSDLVPTQPKHTEIYRQAFGLDDNGDPIPLPEDEEEDSSVKDPYVFIANRLTFLIKTKLPIIFDTSIIETGTTAKVNYMSIAVNTDKTYPKVETVNDIAWVMRECNGSSEIRNEIHEFLEGTEYRDICIFPSTIKRNGQEIPAVRFVIYPKRSQYNFGPAFLNHNK